MSKKLKKLSAEQIEVALRKVEVFFQEQGIEVLEIKGEELIKPRLKSPTPIPKLDWPTDVLDSAWLVAANLMVYTGQMSIRSELKYRSSTWRLINLYDPKEGYYKLWTITNVVNFKIGLQEAVNDSWKKGLEGLMLPMKDVLKIIKEYAID